MLDKLCNIQPAESYSTVSKSVPDLFEALHPTTPNWTPVSFREFGLFRAAEGFVTFGLNSDKLNWGLNYDVKPRMTTARPWKTKIVLEVNL